MITHRSFTSTASVLGGILLIWNVVYNIIPDTTPSHNNLPQPQPPLFITVDVSNERMIPDTLFGIFFEEINHAGAGGLWGELVSNKGFEEGGYNEPKSIDPWGVIGGIFDLKATMELTSCFEHNRVALRIDVLSDLLFDSGVGIYNPGYWGMNIVKGQTYKVTLFSRSTNAMNVTVAFTSFDGFQLFASSTILVADDKWKKVEINVRAIGSYPKTRLQLTTTTRGSIWFDQVSVMPANTYKGHGFRKDLMELLLNLKPRFLRFPGGCYIEGRTLNNIFRWKETVGPWENRPSRFDDVWGYWSDNGMGFLEYLQLAEDLGATPVWVVNAGIAFNEQVNSSLVDPLVQDMLDGIEFARGDINSYWGSLRAKYGHYKPFSLRYVAIGNEDCGDMYPVYDGNYLKFHHALKQKYPNINVINNCDPTSPKLDVPAEMFEYHIYEDEDTVFSKAHAFDRIRRSGPKVAVSEYAVRDEEHPNGTLIAALAEAAFLIGLEHNSDLVSMASYAPLLMNLNDDQGWKSDAIYFDTWRAFGSPSYWAQSFFTESSGSFLLGLNQSQGNNCTSSAIRYKSSQDGLLYIKVKVVNFQEHHTNMSVTFKGLDPQTSLKGSKQTVLTSSGPYDENSLENPTKVIPKSISLVIQKNEISVTLDPYSMTSFDFLIT